MIGFEEAEAALKLRTKTTSDDSDKNGQQQKWTSPDSDKKGHQQKWTSPDSDKKWWTEMDLNGNGVLETAEFDQVIIFYSTFKGKSRG